jgi:glycosyltransferase involved in cell wall biosynthesis
VVTIYDLTFLRYPERLSRARRMYLQAFTARSCRMATRITAISHSTKADLVELLGLPADKIDVTPLGYDRTMFRPMPAEDIAAFKAKKGLPERFWLYLGTLEPRKNLVTLLNAYAKLPKNKRLPLVLAGGKGWDYEPIFQAIEQHKLTDEVTTPGFIPSEDMALWYNSAEIFVYPSVFEGFGLPVLEAMACGTPVITSNVSSLPEVAEGAGLTLPPHEVDTWVNALSQAYDDEAWRTAASTAGLRKAAQFTWENTAKLTLESYQKALA